MEILPFFFFIFFILTCYTRIHTHAFADTVNGATSFVYCILNIFVSLSDLRGNNRRHTWTCVCVCIRFGFFHSFSDCLPCMDTSNIAFNSPAMHCDGVMIYDECVNFLYCTCWTSKRILFVVVWESKRYCRYTIRQHQPPNMNAAMYVCVLYYSQHTINW